MPRGGKRPGAGRPKGSKETKTLEKEAARAFWRDRVIQQLDPLFKAALTSALGYSYLVVRDKRSGKFIRRATETDVGGKLKADREILEIWEKEPSTPAIKDLLDRALDKAMDRREDKVDIPQLDQLVDALKAGRARVAKRKA